MDTARYISRHEVPELNVSPDTRIYAGFGWLQLVKGAGRILGNLPIAAIREDAGMLRIEPVVAPKEVLEELRAYEQQSLCVCECCGEPGLLRYPGTKNGKPAGWHRVRCEAHANARTCPASL